MAVVVLTREFELPIFGAAKWGDADYAIPLAIPLGRAKASIYMEKDTLFASRPVTASPSGRIELTYDPAPEALLKGLRGKTAKTQAGAAPIIYDDYCKAYRIFEAVMYSAGKVRMMLVRGEGHISGFFKDGMFLKQGAVTWSVGGGPSSLFVPKLPKPRGTNRMHHSDQLVTPARWKELQRGIDDQDIPDGELLGLYRIRNKASWRDIRIAAIEASIISESLLRAYGLAVLKANGFSQNKIKRLQQELTFNYLLNVVLPLSLKKTKISRMKKSIDAVDNLRKLRNGLIHGDMSERDVDVPVVERGINGALKLVDFLKKKIP